MVNSIGNNGMSGMHRPDPKEFFNRVDSDSSGGVSQAELQAMTEEMQKISGKTSTISSDNFSSYDTDGNGTLSSDELKTVLESSGFGPPVSGQDGMGPMGPPQQLALNSYDTNSGEDTLASVISDLQNLLDKLTSESDSEDSASAQNSNSTRTGPPSPEDFFKKVDSDSSGGISQDELQTLADNMQKMTGQAFDVTSEAFTSYDSDGDGSLNADELKSALEKNGFGPPPPPPGGERDRAQSTQNSSGNVQDQVAILRDLLKKLSQLDSSDSSIESLVSVTT